MNWWVLKRRVHPSWKIAVTAAFVVVGVSLAGVVAHGWFAPVAWLVTGSGLFLTALRWKYVALFPACVVGGLLIGLWRGSINHHAVAVYDQLCGTTVELSGVVKEDLDTTADRQDVLRLSTITYQGKSLAGTVWVTTKGEGKIQRSDRVTVRGKIVDGFGNFAGSMYRAKITRVERPHPGDVALGVRDWFAENVRRVVPEPEVSLGLGYLLGQRRSLPLELDEALRIAGLTHVIVASGYNLTILVRLARRLFMRISRFSSMAAAGAMVLSFIGVTGMSPSMARAGLVTGLSLLAWYYGRKFHPLILLPIAAATTVLINPSYARGDIGWQLSFAAFAGVMILAPLLQAYFFGSKKPGVIRQIFGETIAAQIATMPILMVVFGQFSNVALIANLLILPLVPLAMLLVFTTGVGVWLWAGLGTLIAVPTIWLLQYMTTTATYLANLPWALNDVTLGGWFIAMYYGVLIAACVYLQRSTQLRLRDSNIVE